MAKYEAVVDVAVADEEGVMYEYDSVRILGENPEDLEENLLEAIKESLYDEDDYKGDVDDLRLVDIGLEYCVINRDEDEIDENY